MLRPRALLLLTALAGALACGPPLEPPPTPPPVDGDSLTSEAIGPTSAPVTIGASGGAIEIAHEGVTYSLTVPGGALVDDVDITLTPARILELPSAIAVEMLPSGTLFDVPATLTITPAPSGEPLVSLTFDSGEGNIEAALAIVADDVVLAPIAHFTTAGAASAAEANAFLPAEVRELVTAANSTDEGPRTGLALGALFRTTVAPLLGTASRDAPTFIRAAGVFSAWIGFISRAAFAADEPHTAGNAQTVAQLRVITEQQLLADGAIVLGRITFPTCSDSAGDVSAPRTWALVPKAVEAAMDELGSVPEFTLCVTTRIRIRGTTVFTGPDDAEMRTTTTAEIVAPGNRTEIVAADFSFVHDDLEGPDSLAGRIGEVSATFTRTLGADRPRAVTVTASALTRDSEFALIAAPAPVTLRAIELGTSATIVATPSTIDSASETATVCARALVDGDAVPTFNAQFTTTGPGSISVNNLSSSGAGEACTTYSPPSPLPAAGGTAVVSVNVVLSTGEELPVSATITLGAGGIALAASSDDASISDDGGTAQVCATVTADDTPVTQFDVGFVLNGAGQISEASQSVVGASDGRACITYTAPTPLPDVTTQVRIDMTATVDGQTATGNVVIDIGPPPPVAHAGRYSGSSAFSQLNRGFSSGTEFIRTTIDRSVAITIDVDAAGGFSVVSATGNVVQTATCGGSTETWTFPITSASIAPSANNFTINFTGGPQTGPAINPCSGAPLFLSGGSIAFTLVESTYVVDAVVDQDIPQPPPLTATAHAEEHGLLTRQ